jgi:N-acyl-phosphatidylethanolamine-hydrolysing phospholipase D
MINDTDINNFCDKDTKDSILAIWIGHATCLINIENKIILLDPVFNERTSPFQFAGPKRFRPVPITIDKIPRIDAVIISHNHYDHLDYGSVLDLNKKFGNKNDANESINWFVGKGTKQWFTNIGIQSNTVHELEWWEKKRFKDIDFVFTPAQHWCKRGLFDRNKVIL